MSVAQLHLTELVRSTAKWTELVCDQAEVDKSGQ